MACVATISLGYAHLEFHSLVTRLTARSGGVLSPQPYPPYRATENGPPLLSIADNMPGSRSQTAPYDEGLQQP